ncbi:hypothetical protein KKH27_10470 [bacterium]|nr:hypothetical protein [bacterium]MBU1984597.1 hypothetical protein [bacterium]
MVFPMDINALTEAHFQQKPELFLELAREWAAGGPEPTAEQVDWLSRAPRPVIVRPAEARGALWGILASPQRAKALSWLDRAGILEEILPCWGGEYFRQALRLQATEEVHLEHWAEGLSEDAYDWLCVYQDQRIDGRMGGWAIAGLATLLLEGDEPADSFANRVKRDLKVIGALPREIERIETAIREYPELCAAILENHPPTRMFTPTTIVATLSTLHVLPEIGEEVRARSRHFGNQLLLRFAAPDTAGRTP